MNWYLVKIVFRIICGNGNHRPQFEEQIRLVSAACMREAVTKTEILVKEEEKGFSNYAGELVQWKMIAITDVYPFSKLTDGAELFSRITEEEHAEAFIHSAKLRAENMFESFEIITH